ncbi:hypothetical protein [Bradyrhizobium sp. Bra64]|uniref:hypothetical protein n=1 Tax=Bradyrhizobium sp. Bra64 TaxID=2926009 RepID=UPI0021174566|nr:hypothetical protein [Bradyrhizobium sp. Bra64]
MTLDHLESHYIDSIALSLDEDVYGANGELDDLEIRSRLMEKIVAQCNYHISGHSGIYEDFISMSVKDYSDKPALTLRQAASLILGVWRYKDCQCMSAEAKLTSWPSLPENQAAP